MKQRKFLLKLGCIVGIQSGFQQNKAMHKNVKLFHLLRMAFGVIREVFAANISAKRSHTIRGIWRIVAQSRK